MSPDVTQLSTREIYRNPWLSLREDEVRFANGTRGIYSVLDKADFVIVLAEQDGGFWMVQQFRYPVGSRQWEFPQGCWPAGADGTPAELAAAELREETGVRAERFTRLGHLHTSPGVSSQSYDVFLASGLTPGEPQRESTESDMVHEWRPLERIRAMVRTGELADAHSIAALALFDAGRETRE